MDPKPFKNKNGSIYIKKIGFIWAKIKPPICDKMKCVRALLKITTYADFEQMVLNAKNVVNNQNFFGRKLGGLLKVWAFWQQYRAGPAFKEIFCKKKTQKGQS